MMCEMVPAEICSTQTLVRSAFTSTARTRQIAPSFFRNPVDWKGGAPTLCRDPPTTTSPQLENPPFARPARKDETAWRGSWS